MEFEWSNNISFQQNYLVFSSLFTGLLNTGTLEVSHNLLLDLTCWKYCKCDISESWLSHIWRKKNKKIKAKPLWQTVQTKPKCCAKLSKQNKGSVGITSPTSTTVTNVASANTTTTQQSTTTTSTTPTHKIIILWVHANKLWSKNVTANNIWAQQEYFDLPWKKTYFFVKNNPLTGQNFITNI